MPAFVALLRAINVGGRGTLAMADLRRAAAAAGLGAPRTLLQSGNLVFEAGADAAPAELERRLEAALADRFGLTTTVLARSRWQWDALVADLPFPNLAATDPSRLVAMVLRAAPDAARRAALAAAIAGPEQAVVRGDVAYVAYPDGIGRSRLTAARIETALGTPGTARNWRTVSRIADALD